MSYHPDYDPILVATSATCGTCLAVSYPVAAEWITDTLILASFDQTHEHGCTRRNTACGTILVNLDAASNEIPHVGRPRICKGTTKAGTACRNHARKASAWCSSHDPARQEPAR